MALESRLRLTTTQAPLLPSPGAIAEQRASGETQAWSRKTPLSPGLPPERQKGGWRLPTPPAEHVAPNPHWSIQPALDQCGMRGLESPDPRACGYPTRTARTTPRTGQGRSCRPEDRPDGPVTLQC